MKREIIISIIFIAIFICLCMMSCEGCSECTCGCDTLTVDKYESKKDTTPSETVTLSGCHILNSCIDCYWLPTACGIFENDLHGTSCVLCGFDCTFLEFYGVSSLEDEHISNVETRSTTYAIEGEDYVIDNFSVAMYDGELKPFTSDDDITFDDLMAIIKLISMTGEDTEIILTLEYTALTELNHVTFSGDVVYKNYTTMNDTTGFYVKQGNTDSQTYKSMNIQPGKHVVFAVMSFDFYELLKLEDINNIQFNAYKYVEED